MNQDDHALCSYYYFRFRKCHRVCTSSFSLTIDKKTVSRFFADASKAPTWPRSHPTPSSIVPFPLSTVKPWFIGKCEAVSDIVTADL
jgi:hypothetical protein